MGGGKRKKFCCGRCGGDHPAIRCDQFKCHTCHEVGHESKDCGKKVCYWCGEEGHIQWGCPKRSTKRQRRGSGGANTSGSGSKFRDAATGVAGAGHSQASNSSAGSSPSQAAARGSTYSSQPQAAGRGVGCGGAWRFGPPGVSGSSPRAPGPYPGSVRVSGPPPPPVGLTRRMTSLDWSERLNVALSTIQNHGLLSEPDFESQLAEVQRQRAEFEDYAARTREWYTQREHALRTSVEQYCLYYPLFRQLASARGSEQPQTESPAQGTEPTLSESLTQGGGTPMDLVVTENQADTLVEPAMVGGGDTTAQPAVIEPEIPVVGEPSEPRVPSEPVAENDVGSAASGEELPAGAETSPVISNQATDGAAPGERNDEKLAAAVGTLPGTGSHEGSQEDGDELLESSAEEVERGSPLDDMRGLSKSVEDIRLGSNLEKDGDSD